MYENIKLFQHDGECPLGIHFVGETLCDEKYCIERRNSDIASFEYIADGHGTLEINGQILHPKKGDIFMITEGSDHRYYSQRDDGWHKFFIGFYGPVIDELISCYLPQNTFLFEGCFADSIFQHIFDIAFNGDDIQQMRSMLAVEVFRLFNHIRDHQKIESEDLADRIKRNIDNRITQNLSLDGLCADMNYSKNHLINIFSEKYGITPYQYYINCRIQIAKDYLATTNMPISEIASVLSYSDQQYFSYSFKKETGCSPKKYRELMRCDIS